MVFSFTTNCRNLQEESHRDDEWVIPFHQTPTSCGNHVLFFVICATKSHKLGNNFSLSRYPGWKDVKWSYADLKPGDCHLVLSCFSVDFVAQIFGLWTVRDFCGGLYIPYQWLGKPSKGWQICWQFSTAQSSGSSHWRS